MKLSKFCGENLVVFDDKLYAGTGMYASPLGNEPCQVLVKKSHDGPWTVSKEFDAINPETKQLIPLTITVGGGTKDILLAAPKDITGAAAIWTLVDGTWHESIVET